MDHPKTFHYLNQSDCYKLDGVDDTEEYLATRRAMDVVGISEEEQVCISVKFQEIVFLPLYSKFFMRNNSFQEGIFRVVAAILHLGNIEFAKGEEVDSSVLKDEKSRFHLNMTAELLRYDQYVCNV